MKEREREDCVLCFGGIFLLLDQKVVEERRQKEDKDKTERRCVSRRRLKRGTGSSNPRWDRCATLCNSTRSSLSFLPFLLSLFKGENAESRRRKSLQAELGISDLPEMVFGSSELVVERKDSPFSFSINAKDCLAEWKKNAHHNYIRVSYSDQWANKRFPAHSLIFRSSSFDLMAQSQKRGRAL